MSTTQPTDPPTAASAAAWLEQIAAQLRTLPTDTPLSINVGIQPCRLNITAAVAKQAVAAVAKALGTTAKPGEMSDGTWHLHASVETRPGWLRVATYTRIEAPQGGADDE